MISEDKLKQVVEAVLFAAGEPLNLEQILKVFPENERSEKADLKSLLQSIMTDYESRSIELKELASGYVFQVRSEFAPYLKELWEERPPRYSRALLETLVLIAYRQPITRADIEEVRGVSVSSYIVRTLLDREWVRQVGHKDVPGRPALYATTKKFLDYFNLKTLADMPTLSEIKDLDQLSDIVEKQIELNVASGVDEAEFEQAEEDLAENLV